MDACRKDSPAKDAERKFANFNIGLGNPESEATIIQTHLNYLSLAEQNPQTEECTKQALRHTLALDHDVLDDLSRASGPDYKRKVMSNMSPENAQKFSRATVVDGQIVFEPTK